jgi:hypothetical protein
MRLKTRKYFFIFIIPLFFFAAFFLSFHLYISFQNKKEVSLLDQKVIYGANDIDFDDILPKLQSLVCDNLEIVVLDGVDHDFTGKVDDFISLIDLL